MNPEFRRQLWLQVSGTRLTVLPLLLISCFVAAFFSARQNPAQALAMTGAALFAVTVLCMGTFAAGASVIDEIADRTWDQQRMSAMQPWAMTWGKLAGASAYGWYGGALCLLVAVPSALLVEDSTQVIRLVLLGMALGVFLQAVLIAINLQLVKAGGRFARRGAFWAVLLVLIWLAASWVATVRGEVLSWWGLGFNRLDFALASLVVFAACALGAAWRSMAEVLAVRHFPWGWPTLALLSTAYLSGFAPAHRLPVFGAVGLTTCAVLTYFAVLAEPQQRPLWQRLLRQLRSRQWRAALLHVPRWPTTLALALPCAVLTMGTWTSAITLPWAAAPALLLHPLAFVLLMARDCAMAQYFAFSSSGRKPTMAFLVLMVVLYGLLPWLVGAMGGRWLVGLVQPLLAGGSLSLALATGHLVLALALLRRRWLSTAP